MPTIVVLLRVMTHFNVGALLAILLWVAWQIQAAPLIRLTAKTMALPCHALSATPNCLPLVGGMAKVSSSTPV